MLLAVSLLPLLFVLFVFVRRPAEKPAPVPVLTVTERLPPSRILPALKEDREAPAPAPQQARAGRAALIIDDLGNSLDAIQILCGLKRPVTASILPFSPATQGTVRLARENGLEVMCHLPLEALHQKIDKASEGTIYTSMTAAEIRKNVLASLDAVPGCRGVNNHTGSMVTEDDRMMPVILSVLKERKLFFIDSRTSPNSIAFNTAVDMGVPAAARQVFLDDVPGEASIKARIEELSRLARDNGQAIGIGHARPETLQALVKYLSLADVYNVKLVFASALVE